MAKLVVDAQVFLEKHKDGLNGLMNDAKVVLDKQVADGEVKEQCAVTSAEIKNSTQTTLTVYSFKNWSGGVLFPGYPPTISANGQFTHASEFVAQPDSGAVVYTSGAANPASYGWLLAWSVPNKPGCFNKVYVEGGSTTKLTNWDYVKNKLEQSCHTCCFLDTNAGNMMVAEITKEGSQATLGAIYSKV